MFIIFFQLVNAYLNIGGDFYIAGSDYGLNYLFPELWVNLSSSSWDSSGGFGKTTFTSAMTFVWSHAIHLFSLSGIQEYFVPKIVYFVFYTTTNLASFFYFKLHLASAYRVSITNADVCVSALIASFFLTLSMYIASMAHHPLNSYHFFIPILFALLLLFEWRALNEYSLRVVALGSFLLVLLANGNLAQTCLVIFFVVVHFTVYGIGIARYSKKIVVQVFLTVFVLSALIGAHIWLPLVGNILISGDANPYGDVGDPFVSFTFNSRAASVSNLLLGTAYPWFEEFDYSRKYFSSILPGIAETILVSLALLTIFNKTANKHKVYWLGALVVTIFLAKGTNPPFSEFWEMLLSKGSAFGAFRAVVHKFGIFIALALSVLFLFSIYELLTSSKRRGSKHAIIISLSLLICLARFPFFTGEIVSQEFKSNVPSEYLELNAYFKKHPFASRVLALPASPLGAGTIHSWPDGQKFLGPHILQFMGVSFVDAAYFIANNYFGTEEEDWWSGFGVEDNLEDVIQHSERLGVNYIFIQKDGYDQYQFNISASPKILNTRKKSLYALSKIEGRRDYRLVLDRASFSLYQKIGSESGERLHLVNKVITE